MNKDAYFNEMRQTSEIVGVIIEQSISEAAAQHDGLGAALYKYVGPRLERHQPMLKPFLIRLSYEISGGKDWIEIAPVCAAAELINVSSYQANYALDGKAGNGTQRQKSDCFIASMITRELASMQLIRFASRNGHHREALELLRFASVSNQSIYYGQFADTNQLVFRNRIRNFACEEEFLREYERRCAALSGEFTAQCAVIGARLGGASEADVSNLHDLGWCFGTGLQVVNDIGDLAPAIYANIDFHKNREDLLSDLRFGKITAPIYFAFISEATGQSDKSWTKMSRDELDQRLMATGALARSRALAKSYYKRCRMLIRGFPNSGSRDLFSTMISSLRSNKYFWALRHGYGDTTNIHYEKAS